MCCCCCGFFWWYAGKWSLVFEFDGVIDLMQPNNWATEVFGYILYTCLRNWSEFWIEWICNSSAFKCKRKQNKVWIVCVGFPCLWPINRYHYSFTRVEWQICLQIRWITRQLILFGNLHKTQSAWSFICIRQRTSHLQRKQKTTAPQRKIKRQQ